MLHKIKIRILLALFLIGSSSCEKNNSQKKQPSQIDKYSSIVFSASEDSIISNSQIGVELARILKNHTGNNVKTLYKGNKFGQLTTGTSLGLCAEVKKKEEFNVLGNILEEINSAQYSVCRYYDDNDKPLIAIIKEPNDLKFIEVRGTQAINNDMYSKDLMLQLELWKENYDFRIIGVANDFIDLYFYTPPVHSNEFKEMVRTFCPDAVDWYNDTEYLLLMQKGGNYLNLWWD